jgi:hypothetical protein
MFYIGALAYNERGMVMFMVGFAVLVFTVLIEVALGGGDALCIYLAGSTWLVWDLVQRWRNARKLFRDTGGGRLYFIPMWVLGLVAIAGGVFLQRVDDAYQQRKIAESAQMDSDIQKLRQKMPEGLSTQP